MKQQFIRHINGIYETNELKNQTYYFFNDMINIKNFDSSRLKIDKQSFKQIDIYCIGYISMKIIGDHESVYSVNPLYLIVGKADGYIEEKRK